MRKVRVTHPRYAQSPGPGPPTARSPPRPSRGCPHIGIDPPHGDAAVRDVIGHHLQLQHLPTALHHPDLWSHFALLHRRANQLAQLHPVHHIGVANPAHHIAVAQPRTLSSSPGMTSPMDGRVHGAITPIFLKSWASASRTSSTDRSITTSRGELLGCFAAPGAHARRPGRLGSIPSAALQTNASVPARRRPSQPGAPAHPHQTSLVRHRTGNRAR